ncbi:MAG: hypothetical protein ACTJG4_07700 [Vreelandella alkaliphila]|uniref:hypothetical protein n=1 Tax=Vreelandella alkaliphila TaxID=272774 RepID=UPI003F957AE1
MTLSVTKVSAPAKRFLATLLPLVLLTAACVMMPHARACRDPDYKVLSENCLSSLHQRFKQHLISLG